MAEQQGEGRPLSLISSAGVSRLQCLYKGLTLLGSHSLCSKTIEKQGRQRRALGQTMGVDWGRGGGGGGGGGGVVWGGRVGGLGGGGGPHWVVLKGPRGAMVSWVVCTCTTADLLGVGGCSNAGNLKPPSWLNQSCQEKRRRRNTAELFLLFQVASLYAGWRQNGTKNISGSSKQK